MARKMCPVCKKVVEEKVIKDGDIISKVCPECGYVFISYQKGKGVLVLNNVKLS
ncbi:MAG: hypothetical protein OWQ50_05345 [Acidianus infernus]|nr:hypothetical protein [Acidianus infernus]MCY0883220.1 hypothetical protein [Acidianus infernus]